MDAGIGIEELASGMAPDMEKVAVVGKVKEERGSFRTYLYARKTHCSLCIYVRNERLLRLVPQKRSTGGNCLGSG